MKVRHENLKSELLTKLNNKVFHFTNLEVWKQIKASGSIIPNQSQIFKTTSTQSHKSLGHHLNAICLFDLREKTKDQINQGIYLYDFLGIHRPKDKACYLIIDPEYYQSLTTFDEVDENLRDSKMYIPEIECWHVGPIALDQISGVYEVSVLG